MATGPSLRRRTRRRSSSTVRRSLSSLRASAGRQAVHVLRSRIDEALCVSVLVESKAAILLQGWTHALDPPEGLVHDRRMYGHGEPDKGTGESIASITTRIQQYKICAAGATAIRCRKWQDIFRTGYADNAIGEEMNEFSVQKNSSGRSYRRYAAPRHQLGVGHQAARLPRDRFQLLRERLIGTSPRPDSHMREAPGVFIVRDDCPNVARTLPILRGEEQPRRCGKQRRGSCL